MSTSTQEEYLPQDGTSVNDCRGVTYAQMKPLLAVVAAVRQRGVQDQDQETSAHRSHLSVRCLIAIILDQTLMLKYTKAGTTALLERLAAIVPPTPNWFRTASKKEEGQGR